jgi:UDP-N-acetylglucosamine 2-epimerase (non-hydrolysing)
LVGVQKERIAGGLRQLISDPAKRAAMTSVNNPYGDGLAAQRIVDILTKMK